MHVVFCVNYKYNNYPAENITWYTAVAYSRWLSSKLGYTVRLPTEREWELAANGGNPQKIYPWGNTWNKNYANTLHTSNQKPIAVGLYPHGAAACGALDMIGNVN